MSQKTEYPTKSREKMKTIDVIFISDELVGDLIIPRKEFEKQQRRLKDESSTEQPLTPKGKKRKPDGNVDNETPKKPKEDDLELALAALENNEVQEEIHKKPSTLFDEDGDVSAGKLYSFQSKRTSMSSPMAKKALMNALNTTPNPKKTLERIEEEPNAQTPYSLRKRVINDIKEIQKILENSDDERDFSPSGSEYSNEESSGEDDNEESPKKNYFNAKKSSSGRSLNNLANPRLTREAVDQVFKNLKILHKPQLTQLFRTQLALFDKWDFLLRQNYNILLYGVGSKKDMIEKFLSRFVAHYPVIKVNGFFPSVTVKDIFDRISDCLKMDLSNSSDAVDQIRTRLADYNIRIYLGINNIDGVMLRSKKSQQILARLAKLDQIRLVATIDHINAPLLWDQCLLTDLNWVWMDATTFLPYTEETSYEGSILLHPSGQLTLASLRSVFNSLTRNARQLFLILAKTQANAEKGWLGMAFRELYHEGRRQLLVSTDSALRLQLKEFIDHAVVKQKRSPEGEEKYYIAMDNSIVKQFLDEQET